MEEVMKCEACGMDMKDCICPKDAAPATEAEAPVMGAAAPAMEAAEMPAEAAAMPAAEEGHTA